LSARERGALFIRKREKLKPKAECGASAPLRRDIWCTENAIVIADDAC
jgi:hypothetical protein